MRPAYTVAEGNEFNYPDAASLKIVEAAGGRSKLSEHDLGRVTFKTVVAGQDCSDMPAATLELYVQRGWVINSSIEIPETPVIPVVVEPEPEVTEPEVVETEEEVNNG